MLRLRCSAGLKLDSFVGPCGLSSADALVLPAVTKHTTVGVTLAHDTARKEAMPAVVTLQSALLYTGADRRRRIRVLTRNLPVTDSLERLVTSAHLPAATGLRAKLALARRMSSGAREVADEVRADCARSLVSQRELCPPPLKRVGDELICAKALGLLPLFTQAVTRAVVRAGDPDEVAAEVLRLGSLPSHLTSLALMPRVYVVHLASEGSGWLEGVSEEVKVVPRSSRRSLRRPSRRRAPRAR